MPNGRPTRKAVSERRVKENIVRIGDHPFGFGLYLFDYRPEYRAQWGQGRQFGVMIDEVEIAMPEAVSMHPDGYKRVDYAMLGIASVSTNPGRNRQYRVPRRPASILR